MGVTWLNEKSRNIFSRYLLDCWCRNSCSNDNDFPGVCPPNKTQPTVTDTAVTDGSFPLIGGASSGQSYGDPHNLSCASMPYRPVAVVGAADIVDDGNGGVSSKTSDASPKQTDTARERLTASEEERDEDDLMAYLQSGVRTHSRARADVGTVAEPTSLSTVGCKSKLCGVDESYDGTRHDDDNDNGTQLIEHNGEGQQRPEICVGRGEKIPLG